MTQNNNEFDTYSFVKHNSLGRILNEFHEIVKPYEGPFLFRGQKCSRWQLSSSAERRIITDLGFNSNEIPDDIYFWYHKRLIDMFKLKGLHRRKSHELYDLEILAEIQHFGGATGLLDFSRNSLIALWFACDPSNCEDCNYKNSEKCKIVDNKPEGTVIIVKNLNANFTNTVTHEALSNIPLVVFLLNRKGEPLSIESSNMIHFQKEEEEYDQLNGYNDPFFQFPSVYENNTWIWESSSINNRIPIQQSTFILNPKYLPKGNISEVIIPHKDKKIIRSLLDLFSISMRIPYSQIFQAILTIITQIPLLIIGKHMKHFLQRNISMKMPLERNLMTLIKLKC